MLFCIENLLKEKWRDQNNLLLAAQGEAVGSTQGSSMMNNLFCYEAVNRFIL